MDQTPRNKAERLALACAIAPGLRESTERTSKRRVARVDKDGNVVGYTTLDEVQKSLLMRHQIEIEVQPGAKPKEVPCPSCGLPIKVPKSGPAPKRCRKCKAACVECAGYEGYECKEKAGREVLKPKLVRVRKGRPWRCKACHHKWQTAWLKSRKCAGYEGHECSASSSVHGTRNSRHREWRCKPCSAAFRRLKGAARRAAIQFLCAGFSGHACDKPVPAYALTPSVVASRHGRPWRCKECSLAAPEYRELRSKIAKESMQDPKRREKNRQHMQKWCTDPEWKAEQAEKMRKLRADEKVQAKRIQSVRRALKKRRQKTE